MDSLTKGTFPAVKHGREFVLAIIGMGLLLGSVWSSRGYSVFGSATSLSLAHVLSLGVFCVAAFMFWNRAISYRPILLFAAVFLHAHIAVVAASFAFQPGPELFAFGLLSSLFEGAFFALGQIVFVVLLCGEGPVLGVTGVAASFLVANFYDCFFISAEPRAIVVQWIAGKLVVFGLMVWTSRYFEDAAFFLRGSVLPDSQSSSASNVIQISEAGDNRSEDIVSSSESLVAFGIFVALLMLSQGVFATMTGLAGVGEHAYFDLYIGILMVGVRLLVLAYVVLAGGRIRPYVVVAGCALMWAAGLLLVTLWDGQSVAMGEIIIQAGTYVLQVLGLAVGVQYVCLHREHAFSVVCLFLAAIQANHVSRFATYFFVDPSVPLTSYLVSLAVGIAFCVLVVALVIMELFLRRNAASAVSFDQEISKAIQDSVAASLDDGERAVFEREVDFSKRFRRLCEEKGLTKREEEVLLETLHGYSIEATADKLCLSKETVKTYLSRMYSRIGVSGKQEVLKIIDSYTFE